VKNTYVFCDFLFEVETQAIFVAKFGRGRYVGRPGWTINRILITAHVGAIQIGKNPNYPRVSVDAVTALKFRHHAPSI
jgi:3-hydroxyacyl-CoA dehydrogenase